MFKPFAKTIVLITLFVLASACEPTVPPTPASTSTPEMPIIAPTITPMQALTPTTTLTHPVYNVVIFDLETYKQVANLVSDYEYIFNLIFSPDGNTLVVGYERPGNVIKLGDTATWLETSTFTHVSQRIDYHFCLGRRGTGLGSKAI